MIIVKKQAVREQEIYFSSLYVSCWYSHGGICWTLAVAAGGENGVGQG